MDAKKDDDFDVEDLATALIRYDNGAVTLIETSYSLNGESREGEKEIYGTKGGMTMKGFGTELKLYTEVNGFLADVTPDIKGYKPDRNKFDEEMAHFVDCIKNILSCLFKSVLNRRFSLHKK